MKEQETRATRVILGGTGGLGVAVAQELIKQGHYVRVVSRNIEKAKKIYKNETKIEFFEGNMVNLTDMEKAIGDASVVFNCINPPYDKWEKYWPPILTNLMTLIQKRKFTHVFGDNIYSYGPIQGEKLVEEQAMMPTGKNGKIRKRVLETLMSNTIVWSHTIVVKFGDFFGPFVLNPYTNQLFWNPIQGKAVYWLFNAKQPHSFIYIKDAAKAMVALSEKAQAQANIWLVAPPEALTGEEFITRIFQATGNKPKYTVSGTLILRVIGLFDPIVRRVIDNKYQWNEPLIFDTSKFSRLFPEFTYTPIDKAIKETVAWYRDYPFKEL